MRGEFGPLRYSLAGFAMEKDNVIFRDANAFNVSDGRTDHEGVEYEFAWSPLDVLSLAAPGTYAEHTYDFDRAVERRRDDRRRARRRHCAAPREHRARRMAVPAGSERGARMGVGRHATSSMPPTPTSYGGHDLLNLRVGYRIRDELDHDPAREQPDRRAYADRADFAFGNYRYFPGRGRSAFVEVQLRRVAALQTQARARGRQSTSQSLQRRSARLVAGRQPSPLAIQTRSPIRRRRRWVIVPFTIGLNAIMLSSADAARRAPLPNVRVEVARLAVQRHVVEQHGLHEQIDVVRRRAAARARRRRRR